MIPMLTSSIGKYATLAVVGAVVAALSFGLISQYRAGVRAEQTAAEQAAVIQTMHEQQATINDALVTARQEVDARTAELTETRKAISHAPVTTACARVPVIAAALDGLRVKPSGHH